MVKDSGTLKSVKVDGRKARRTKCCRGDFVAAMKKGKKGRRGAGRAWHGEKLFMGSDQQIGQEGAGTAKGVEASPMSVRTTNQRAETS